MFDRRNKLSVFLAAGLLTTALSLGEPVATHARPSTGPATATVRGHGLALTLTVTKARVPRDALVWARLTVTNHRSRNFDFLKPSRQAPRLLPLGSNRRLKGRPPFKALRCFCGLIRARDYVHLRPGHSLSVRVLGYTATDGLGTDWLSSYGLPMVSVRLRIIPSVRSQASVRFDKSGRAWISVHTVKGPSGPLYYSYYSSCTSKQHGAVIRTPDSPTSGGWVKGDRRRLRAGNLDRSCVKGHIKAYAGWPGYPAALVAYQLPAR